MASILCGFMARISDRLLGANALPKNASASRGAHERRVHMVFEHFEVTIEDIVL